MWNRTLLMLLLAVVTSCDGHKMDMEDFFNNCTKFKDEELCWYIVRRTNLIRRREMEKKQGILEYEEYCKMHCCNVGATYETKHYLKIDMDFCGEVKKAYPPCRALGFRNDTIYPNCCPLLVCPPYFSYLDAYLYTYSLIVSKGKAPLIYGNVIPPSVREHALVHLSSDEVVKSMDDKSHGISPSALLILLSILSVNVC